MKIVLDLAGFGSFRIVDNGVFVGLGGVLVLEVSGNSAAGASWSASRSKPTLFSCSSRVCRSTASYNHENLASLLISFPSLGADYEYSLIDIEYSPSPCRFHSFKFGFAL